MVVKFRFWDFQIHFSTETFNKLYPFSHFITWKPQFFLKKCKHHFLYIKYYPVNQI